MINAVDEKMQEANDELDNEIKKPPVKVHTTIPKRSDLAEGEDCLVQLRPSQLAPNFPPRACVYRYFKANNRLFRHLVEEVTE